jgi:hypothetical protein
MIGFKHEKMDVLAVTFKSDILFGVDSASLKPGAFNPLRTTALLKVAR